MMPRSIPHYKHSIATSEGTEMKSLYQIHTISIHFYSPPMHDSLNPSLPMHIGAAFNGCGV